MRIGAELTHRCWRSQRASVSWARRRDRRWIVASDPFFGVRDWVFRAGNYSVRTVGENILGGYIEGAEDISHVHCT